VRSPPDGYTLLLATSSNTANATLYEKLNFNFIRDIAPVASIVFVPSVLVVHPSFPAKTAPDFIGYAKADPRKINMAAVGIGSATHLFGELFKSMAGVDLVAVCSIAIQHLHTPISSPSTSIFCSTLLFRQSSKLRVASYVR
jgi:tripartite-type tricarboxylate transporter receptor subunit TctC